MLSLTIAVFTNIVQGLWYINFTDMGIIAIYGHKSRKKTMCLKFVDRFLMTVGTVINWKSLKYMRVFLNTVIHAIRKENTLKERFVFF